jgi:hypothetical protein
MVMGNLFNENIIPPPGIQRDKTPYSSPFCIDGEWNRFYEGVPMSMLGYKSLDLGNNVIVRSMFNLPVSAGNKIYTGRYNSIHCLEIDTYGQVVGVDTDVSPSGMATNNETLWSFSSFTNTVTQGTFVEGETYVVALQTKSAFNVQNDDLGNLFAGNVATNEPLQPVPRTPDGTMSDVVATGGVVSVAPILIVYGRGGSIQWCYPGQINNWTAAETIGATPVFNTQNIADTKIIKAFPTPGASDPTVLFWSLDQVVRATWVQSEETPAGRWIAQVIQPHSSLMSSNAVVPYNQEFYWVGTSQFYRYNGVVQPLPNNMNSQYFFDYIHKNARGKVWGVANPRFQEIWFFFPKKENRTDADDQDAEVNHAIIYNVELNTFYDTPVTRSAGIEPSSFEYPVWAESQLTPIPTPVGIDYGYPLWQQEIGEDRILTVGDTVYTAPIKKSVTFPIITAFETNPENNRSIRANRLELDLVQQGPMDVEVLGRRWARSEPISKGPYTFTSDTTYVDDIYSQGRLINFKFTSNTPGGFYQFGKLTMDYKLGSVVP